MIIKLSRKALLAIFFVAVVIPLSADDDVIPSKNLSKSHFNHSSIASTSSTATIDSTADIGESSTSVDPNPEEEQSSHTPVQISLNSATSTEQDSLYDATFDGGECLEDDEGDGSCKYSQVSSLDDIDSDGALGSETDFRQGSHVSSDLSSNTLPDETININSESSSSQDDSTLSATSAPSDEAITTAKVTTDTAEIIHENEQPNLSKKNDIEIKADIPDETTGLTNDLTSKTNNPNTSNSIQGTDATTNNNNDDNINSDTQNQNDSNINNNVKKQKEEEEEEEDLGSKEQIVVNYAHKSAGAVVLEKSPSFKGTSNLLTSDNDRYAIAPCDEEKKSVVIGLSEDILVKQVVLANFERYSSHVHLFQVLGSQTYPIIGNWDDLGTYTAQPGNGVQRFDLVEPSWARYLKFKFVSHYGEEHFCTVSQIKVHGSTMLQGFHEQWNQKEAEEQEHQQQQQIKMDNTVVEDRANTQQKGNAHSRKKTATDVQVHNLNPSIDYDSVGMNTISDTDVNKIKTEANITSATKNNPPSINQKKNGSQHSLDHLESGIQKIIHNVSTNNEKTNTLDNDQDNSGSVAKSSSEDTMVQLQNKSSLPPPNESDLENHTLIASGEREDTELTVIIPNSSSRLIDPPGITKTPRDDTSEGELSNNQDINSKKDSKKTDDTDVYYNKIADAVKKIKAGTITVSDAVKKMTEGSPVSYETVKKLSNIIKDTISKQRDDPSQEVTTVSTIDTKSEIKGEHHNSNHPEIADDSYSIPSIQNNESVANKRDQMDEKTQQFDQNDDSPSSRLRLNNEKKNDNTEKSSQTTIPSEMSSGDKKETQSNSKVDEISPDLSSNASKQKSLSASSSHSSIPRNPFSTSTTISTSTKTTSSTNVGSISNNHKMNSQMFSTTSLSSSYDLQVINCIDNLGSFDDFKTKMAAQRLARMNSIPGGNSAAVKMEPIFKTLTDEIKALQLHQNIYDQYLKSVVECYQQVIVEMSQEMNRLETKLDKRMSVLENYIDQLTDMKKQEVSSASRKFPITLAAAASSSLQFFISMVKPKPEGSEEKINSRLELLLNTVMKSLRSQPWFLYIEENSVGKAFVLWLDDNMVVMFYLVLGLFITLFLRKLFHQGGQKKSGKQLIEDQRYHNEHTQRHTTITSDDSSEGSDQNKDK